MTNPPGAMPPLPEPLDHLYEFGSPFGGVHRTADSSTWNGSRPKRSVAVYTAEQMQTYAAPLIARVAELQAEREVLREALDWCVAEINRESPAVINARAALTPTKD